MPLFDPFPVLHTPRLHLRAPCLADAPDFHRHDTDLQVRRYLSRPPPSSLAVTEAKVAGMVDNTDAVAWVLADATTGAFLGYACLWHWDQLNARAELGYVLDPARWGQGLVPEALTPILQFGFERMSLHAIEAWVHPDNHASIRVLAKLGFIKEAHFREHELNLNTHSWDDVLVYTLLRP